MPTFLHSDNNAKAAVTSQGFSSKIAKLIKLINDDF